MVSEPVQTLVIGGGISGLALAHYAASLGKTTLVLEQEAQTGGCLHSHRFADSDGFWTELGAHTCYNSYVHLLRIMEDCGLLTQILPKDRLPFRLLSDGSLGSVLSRLSWLELLGSLPNLLRLKKAGTSVADYYGRIVGRGNFARVVSPALDAVICQPASGFPADALFRKRQRRKDVVRSFSLSGGVQDVARALSERPDVAVKTGQPVRSVAATPEGYTVTTADGTRFQGEKLVVATNVTSAAGLLAPAFPEITELLGRIREVEIESLSVMVKAERVPLERLAGIIAVNDSFYSMVSRDPVPDGSFRGFTFHFRPGRLDQEAKLQRISEVLGVSPADILEQAARTNRLPSFQLDHAELTARVDARLAGTTLGLTGNYFAGVSIEDCLTRSRSELLRLYPETQ